MKKNQFFSIFFALCVYNFLELNFCRRSIIDDALERLDLPEVETKSIGDLTSHVNRIQ